MKFLVADQLVELLKQAGIKRIYGVTGDSLNFFNDAIRRDGTLQWVHVRHEEAGAFAAMAEGVLGGFGCCAGSSGPGHVHLLNGLYDAQRYGSPVLALPSTILSHEYGSESFQSTDLSMFNGCSYYNEVATTTKQFPMMVHQAIQYAWSKKGVGVCAFPGDLMMKAAYKKLPLAGLYASNPIIRPNDDELNAIAELINASTNIGIYVGLGGADARQEVLDLASLLNAPIAYTLKAKMTFEYENPFAVGMTGLLGSSAAEKALTQSDVLIMLGSDFPWRDFLDGRVRIIQIDVKPERLGRRVALNHGFTGDIKASLIALLPLLSAKKDDAFLKTCLQEYQKVQTTYQKHAEDPGEENYIKPEYIMAKISKFADENAIFTSDTGMSTVWAARYLKSTGLRCLLGSFSHGSMANAMPQAIGAAFHSPHKQVIALCGDGGISMLIGDLMTIRQYDLPIKIVVFNNRALGMVELEMQVAGLPDWQTKMLNPDFGALAASCGIQGYTVRKPEELEQSLHAFLDFKGPALFDVYTNPFVPVLPPHTSLSMVSRYMEAQAKLTANGRLKEVWRSVKTAFQYLRDL